MNWKRTARITGMLYLVIAVVMGWSFTAATSNLVVPGDAAATAGNIRAAEMLFRAGAVGDAVTFMVEIVLSILLYTLFKRVNQTLALVATASRLAMAAMQGMNLLNKFVALFLVTGAGPMAAFEPGQVDALALLFLNAYEYGALIWGTFFGLHLVVLGYLIFKSGYVPRGFGVLFWFASFGYLVDSLGHFLLPQYTEIYSWVVWATVPAELAFALWLLIKGVKVEPAR